MKTLVWKYYILIQVLKIGIIHIASAYMNIFWKNSIETHRSNGETNSSLPTSKHRLLHFTDQHIRHLQGLKFPAPKNCAKENISEEIFKKHISTTKSREILRKTSVQKMMPFLEQNFSRAICPNNNSNSPPRPWASFWRLALQHVVLPWPWWRGTQNRTLLAFPWGLWEDDVSVKSWILWQNWEDWEIEVKIDQSQIWWHLLTCWT